jgi:hypothetical protein
MKTIFISGYVIVCKIKSYEKEIFIPSEASRLLLFGFPLLLPPPPPRRRPEKALLQSNIYSTQASIHEQLAVHFACLLLFDSRQSPSFFGNSSSPRLFFMMSIK